MTVFPQVDYVCIVHDHKISSNHFFFPHLCTFLDSSFFTPLTFANVKEVYAAKFYASLALYSVKHPFSQTIYKRTQIKFSSVTYLPSPFQQFGTLEYFPHIVLQ